MPSTKRGRKPRPYICPWNNEVINGLYRCPDGRWRITVTGEKYTEPDPRLAVRRFRTWQARQSAAEALIPLPMPRLGDGDADGALEFLLAAELGQGTHRAVSDDSLLLTIPGGADPIQLLRAVPAEHFWSHVREEIIQRPKYVAEMSGIEQIAYLPDLKRPTPSPTLEELGALFLQRKQLGANWKSKCRAFWAEFQQIVGVATVREVTQELVTDYKDQIEALREKGSSRFPAGFSSTYVRQRFEAVKSIVSYPPKDRGQWRDDCKVLRGYCEVLVKPRKSRPKPTPISPQHFHRLVEASPDERFTAAMLLSLNMCMYLGEAVRVFWEDINLETAELIGEREKLGKVIRIGVIWERTAQALRALGARPEGPVFLNNAGNPMTYDDIKRLFDKARCAAGLDGGASRTPQPSDIRDGAYTTAVRAKVGLNIVKMLAGHETGVPDNYVMRDPSMVKPACDAIEARYFPPTNGAGGPGMNTKGRPVGRKAVLVRCDEQAA